MSNLTPTNGPLFTPPTGVEAMRAGPMAPAEFAASRLTMMAGLLAPVAALGIGLAGLKMIVTGESPLKNKKKG